MTDEQALSNFIKANLETLLRPDLAMGDLRRAVGQHFSQANHRKLAKPGFKDIIQCTIRHLTRVGIQRLEIAEYVIDRPLFKFAGDAFAKTILDELLAGDSSSALKPEHVELIRQVGAYEAVKRLRGDQIDAQLHREREHVSAELNRQKAEWETEIARKRAEYDSLPSVLDLEPPAEPEFDPTRQDLSPWWERFYLRSNPFPLKDGLADIDKRLYEDVLVKTKPFNLVLSSLKRDPAYLFRTGFLLVGDYGYGKTTFIDYLTYYLIRHNIVPIRITCGKPFPDSAGFADNFYIRLRNELRAELLQAESPSIGEDTGFDLEGQIIQLAKALTQRSGGIVVFLDDYHKHRSHFQQIYEFLGTLQILKDQLNRAGINAGFVVSGTSDWKAELQRNGQMSGFLDNTPIEMPALTPELVCDIFNYRIAAYCFDQSPRRIQIEFVRHLFDEPHGRAGIRDYLTRIISELSNNNLAIVDSPIEISDDKLALVKAELEKSSHIRGALTRLLRTSRFKKYTNDQIAHTLEILVQIAVQEGVAETDRLFSENSYYFAELREDGFIQKGKPLGATSERYFKWVLHSELRQVADSIKQRYRLGLSDYLLKIYGYKSNTTAPIPAADRIYPELGEIKSFFSVGNSRLPESVLANANAAFRGFDAVVRVEPDTRLDSQVLQRAMEAFECLSRALFEADCSAPVFSSASIQDSWEKWDLHWFDHEALLEARRRVSDPATTSDQRAYNVAVKALCDAFVLVAQQLKVVVRGITEGPPMELLARPSHHNDDEIKILQGVGRDFYSGDVGAHIAYMRRVTDYIELRIRAFLYTTGVLLWGDGYASQIPDGDRQYAHRNIHECSNYASIVNYFEGLTRPQFRKIFTEKGCDIKASIIDQLRTGWQTQDWSNFFDHFLDANIMTAHQKTSAFSVADRTRYVGYARMGETLMQAMNRFVAERLLSGVYFRREGTDGSSGIQSYVARYCYQPLPKSETIPDNRVMSEWPSRLKRQGIADHSVTDEQMEKVMRLLTDNIQHSPGMCHSEDLLQAEYLVSHYGVPYPAFITVLAFSHYISGRIRVYPGFGSSVLLRYMKA